MSVPPSTAITRPTKTYSSATLHPKILISSISEPKSTIGEEIKNENVTPTGRPALENPMNSGMDEQEQKGVTVPSSAAIQFAPTPRKRPNIFLLRSGGK